MISKIKKILGKSLPYRKTKIICTIGPASGKEVTLKKMIAEGMDFARFNFSHGSFEEFAGWAKMIRAFASKAGRKVEIIQDLQGPRVRLGKLPHEGRHIDAGSIIHLVFNNADGDLHRGDILIQNDVEFSLNKGDRILMDKGLIELEVKKIESSRATCKALTGGIIFSGKGINLPNAKTDTALTAKDLEDIKHGLQIGVDWVALSFVESADDIKTLREKTGDKVKIIAKIERPQAIHNFSEILEASDAVMIARGDLGIEIQYWKLPIIQKRAIRRAKNAGKSSIVATDMMVSMTLAQRPTRAEVLDVANAVIDGASAVMLSDETAVGKYPLEALVAMRKIIEETEEFDRGQELKSLLG